jgi:hypothetical protein
MNAIHKEDLQEFIRILSGKKFRNEYTKAQLIADLRSRLNNRNYRGPMNENGIRNFCQRYAHWKSIFGDTVPFNEEDCSTYHHLMTMEM